ncbi:MAG: WbqC family protein [Prolixibacteraceae bacterium]
MNREILLSSAYLPPVQYLSKFLQYDTVVIEAEENFLKQTYRNRTIILTANGPESLVIPVAKGRDAKQKIRDLEISYDSQWQHIHWQAIVSAYHSSPFFEILQDDFSSFFKKKFRFLFDFNMQLLRVILDILEVSPEIRLTTAFEDIPETCLNFREAIHPKIQKATPDPDFIPVPYSQVFDDKFAFEPNLSVIDLLFNSGPESYEILLKSIPGH